MTNLIQRSSQPQGLVAQISALQAQVRQLQQTPISGAGQAIPNDLNQILSLLQILGFTERRPAPSLGIATGSLMYFSATGPLWLPVGTPGQLAAVNAAGDQVEFIDHPKALLAHTVYNPGGTDHKTISATTFTDVDSTNLAITFVAPASGIVEVVLTNLPQLAALNTTATLYWSLREATTNLSGTDGIVRDDIWSSSQNVYTKLTHRVFVTGLTPGSSHTYKWAAKRDTNNYSMRIGGAYGPTTMEVWEV